MIVAFVGEKGSGKDTAVEQLPLNNKEVVKFAGPLKEMLRTLLREQFVDEDTIERMIEGDLKELPTKYLGGKSPRHAMVTLGTEWGRECMAENLWTEIARNKVEHLEQSGVNVFITDCRFLNEAEAVKDMGGILVRITRPGCEAKPGAHVSETEMSRISVDHTINNSGTLPEFAYMTRSILLSASLG